MKRFISPLLFMLMAAQLPAQDLLINYDFVRDQFSYAKVKKNGKAVPIGLPAVKRNYDVKVQVTNFNPFVYSANCTFTEKEVVSSNTGAGFNFGSLIPGGSMLGGLGGSLFSQLNLVNPIDPDDQGSTTRGASGIWESQAMRVTFDNVLTNYNKLYSIQANVNRIDFAAAKINELRFNPFLPGDTVVSLTRGLVSNVLNKRAPTTSDFLEANIRMNKEENESYMALISSAREFQMNYQAFTRSMSFGFEGMGTDAYVNSLVQTAENLHKELTTTSIAERLNKLEYNYQAVLNTPYRYSNNARAMKDEMVVNIDFYDISLIGPRNRIASYVFTQSDSIRLIRNKKINVITKGDIKINSSVGLTFPSYFDKNVNYENRDSVITSSPGSNFSPMLGTFLNFYPYTGRNNHLGGSFGVGVPINQGGLSGLHFMLGLSSIMGNTNKVVLSGGLSIGQLDVLDFGFKAGDRLSDDRSTVPLKKQYQTGAYFALSFAIGNIKN
jgi:hypothetical protein